MLSACGCLDQPEDRIHGVRLFAGAHGPDIIFPVGRQGGYRMQQGFSGQFLFFENHGKALAFEGSGVQDLIAAAGSGGERNQKHGLLEL